MLLFKYATDSRAMECVVTVYSVHDRLRLVHHYPVCESTL